MKNLLSSVGTPAFCRPTRSLAARKKSAQAAAAGQQQTAAEETAKDSSN
jgi:hypothetical protein